LCRNTIRGLLHMDATSRTQIFEWGNPMTTSNSSNRQSSYIDDSILDLGRSYGMTAAAALYYPSLAGNCWDDELLPSGD